MSGVLKVIPDRFRDIVGLHENVEKHLTNLPRSRRRAIWSGVSTLVKRGLFGAKAMLAPYVHFPIDGIIHLFGALNQGGCVTIVRISEVGISDLKLTLYSIIDRARLLKRAGEQRYCMILDQEFVSDTETARISIAVVEYQYIVWSAYIERGVKERWARLQELLPQQSKPIWN